MFLLRRRRSYLSGLARALFPAMIGFVVAWYVAGYFNSRNAISGLSLTPRPSLKIFSLTLYGFSVASEAMRGGVLVTNRCP